MNNTEESTFVFRQLFHKDTGTFTYLMFDSSTMEGLIIYPVKEQFDRSLQFIEELGVELNYVIDTHVHADHVTSSGMLRDATGAKSAFGENSAVQCEDILLCDGDELEFGRFKLIAISTPGHTDACTSFYTEGRLFAGDSLLIRGCGRTDFQQGDPEKLFDSITQTLYPYPDTTLVYPGHDYLGRTASCIRKEKSFNPRIVSGQTLENFVQIMNNLNLPKPKRIDEAVPQNMKCGYSLQLGHVNEDNFNMNDLYKLLDNLNPTERVIDVQMPSDYNQGHMPGSLNIPMGNEQAFIDEIRGYDRVFLYCHSGRRAQTDYTMRSMQGLENLVCINSSGMTDWHQASFPVEQ
jgi:sulfur dioxygenase